MAAPSPSAPRRRRRKNSRRGEILREAVGVFGHAGYERARLADIARQAGISKAALYLYFPSKAALFGEMIRAEVRAGLGQEDAAAGFFPDSPEKQLRRFLRDAWTALRRPELRSITRLVHAELSQFPELARLYFEEVILTLRARLERVLDTGRARGVFRSVAHDFALQAIPSFLLHQAMLRDGLAELDPRPLSDDQLVEGSLDLLLHGLLRRGSPTAAE